MSVPPGRRRIFLLSPAKVTGERAQLVMRDAAAFDLAVRLRTHGAPLGEVFSFMSGLYFRGKHAYARAFADPPPGVPGSLVITAGFGLLPSDTIVTRNHLRSFAGFSVDINNAGYVSAVRRDATLIRESIGNDCAVILLGSVATLKYLEPLKDVFGEQLFFPRDFIGRGDLSRGGLLLRAVRAATELVYAPVGPSTHHGARPEKLSRVPPGKQK